MSEREDAYKPAITLVVMGSVCVALAVRLGIWPMYGLRDLLLLHGGNHDVGEDCREPEAMISDKNIEQVNHLGSVLDIDAGGVRSDG